MCPNLHTAGSFWSSAVSNSFCLVRWFSTDGGEMVRSGESSWKLPNFPALALFFFFVFLIQMSWDSWSGETLSTQMQQNERNDVKER